MQFEVILENFGNFITCKNVRIGSKNANEVFKTCFSFNLTPKLSESLVNLIALFFKTFKIKESLYIITFEMMKVFGVSYDNMGFS